MLIRPSKQTDRLMKICYSFHMLNEAWNSAWRQNTLIQNLLSLMKVMAEFVSISSDNGIDHNDQDDAEDRKVLAMIIQKKKKKKKE